MISSPNVHIDKSSTKPMFSFHSNRYVCARGHKACSLSDVHLVCLKEFPNCHWGKRAVEHALCAALVATLTNAAPGLMFSQDRKYLFTQDRKYLITALVAWAKSTTQRTERATPACRDWSQRNPSESTGLPIHSVHVCRKMDELKMNVYAKKPRVPWAVLKLAICEIYWPKEQMHCLDYLCGVGL